MNIEQQITYLDKSYKILNTEQEFIIHPAAFGMIPISKAALQCNFTVEFIVDNYRLILKKITLQGEDGNDILYEPTDCNVTFNGAILVGSDPVKEYYLNGDQLVCFSYQNVLELIFDQGMLITTVDQAKAMLRIRKNLELGLRNLNYKRDLRCIKRFINSSLVGDYKSFLFNNMRLNYLKDMADEYKNMTF